MRRKAIPVRWEKNGTHLKIGSHNGRSEQIPNTAQRIQQWAEKHIPSSADQELFILTCDSVNQSPGARLQYADIDTNRVTSEPVGAGSVVRDANTIPQLRENSSTGKTAIEEPPLAVEYLFAIVKAGEEEKLMVLQKPTLSEKIYPKSVTIENTETALANLLDANPFTGEERGRMLEAWRELDEQEYEGEQKTKSSARPVAISRTASTIPRQLVVPAVTEEVAAGEMEELTTDFHPPAPATEQVATR